MRSPWESRLLKQNLRLTRRDIEHQGLDRLETFLAPDILADEELVKVLEESGCGSLLELARSGFPRTEVENRAEELKKFLRIGEGSHLKLSRHLCSPFRRLVPADLDLTASRVNATPCPTGRRAGPKAGHVEASCPRRYNAPT